MSLASRFADAFSWTSASKHKEGAATPAASDDVSSPSHTMSPKVVETEGRPSYFHAMLAGGIGGITGDFLMHSLDTVKTRQQGDPHFPPKYTTLPSSYATILRQEGIVRGLYGGWFPAMMGSFPGTILFFGTYEASKRNLLDAGCNAQLAYLTSGFVADLAASIVYVPSEVLKTRLQLQGRHNNPHFASGYNYRSTRHAVRTLLRTEGAPALFYGYRATLLRDLPFSALQFTFYEQGQKWSKQWKGRDDIGPALEAATGAAAGGLAGVITCPLDVVKTRIQTQVNPAAAASSPQKTPATSIIPPSPASQAPAQPPRPPSQPLAPTSKPAAPAKTRKIQFRHISTSSPSTHTPKPGAMNLHTSSVLTGLKIIYRTEGIGGWFRGVGPRFVWTSVQSGIMLFCYQTGLKLLRGWGEGRAEREDRG